MFGQASKLNFVPDTRILICCRCLNILVNVDQVFCVCCCKRQNEKTESNTQARNSESNIQLSVVAYEPYNQTKQTTATTTKKKHKEPILLYHMHSNCHFGILYILTHSACD